MPNLDGELTALRDTMRDSLHQPELDSVLARSRQRTTRRRTQLSAAAAVLVVAAAIPVLRAEAPQEPGRPAPPASSVTSTPVIDDVDFGDERTGYALREVCADSVCEIDLLVTEDAQHWYPRRLPDVGQSHDRPIPTLDVLGPSRIIVESRVLPRTTPRWYSDDGGQSWRQVPEEFAPDVEAIPDGAILRPRCGGDMCGHIAGVEVVLPDSGRSAMLVTQPPLDDLVPGRIPAGDGAWWVSGKDRATGRSALAVSRDAGRSWQVAVLQEPGLPAFAIGQVTAVPGTMYATALGSFDGGGTGLLAIFASTDGGRTWAHTWRPAADKEPLVSDVTAMAEPDGGLTVVAEAARVYHSTDHGMTFELTGARLGTVRWTRVGYLVRNPGTDNVYFRFAPDATWSQITVE